MKSKLNGARTVSTVVASAAVSIAAGVAMDVSQSNPCLAQEGSGSGCVDWEKLNLSSSQAMQIKELDQEWYKESDELKRQIRDEQAKLQRVLSEHNSDGMAVVSSQQAVENRRGELRILATRIYLAKKKVLDDTQKKQLEEMMRLAVNNRKRQLYPGSQTEVMPDKIQSLMQRVRDIWPVNSDH